MENKCPATYIAANQKVPDRSSVFGEGGVAESNKLLALSLREKQRPTESKLSGRVSVYGEPRVEGEEFRMVFKFRVRQARRSADISQAKMAEIMGVKVTTYAKWENTTAGMMRHYRIPEFCELVDLKVQDLFYPYIRVNERRLISLGF